MFSFHVRIATTIDFLHVNHTAQAEKDLQRRERELAYAERQLRAERERQEKVSFTDIVTVPALMLVCRVSLRNLHSDSR